ncbi:Baseplate assembly protein [Candidatus Magnetomoraceae bacterium gMMP-15]
MSSNNIYGQDILLGSDLEPEIAANGEPILTEEAETAVQDIILRLKTPLGSLFYDQKFGSNLYLYNHDENTLLNRQAIYNEVITTIQKDSRVDLTSPKCEVISWDESGITLESSFALKNEVSIYNLMINLNDQNITVTMEVIIKDVNPS